MSAIQVNFEIGCEASKRTKTSDGFTNDLKLFVRGEEGADISHFVDKVVFRLHETLPKPKRVVKEPPFTIKESGYAGFSFRIDIYVKNNDKPIKIKFAYDTTLQQSGFLNNMYIFPNPNDKFRKKLLKGGGIAVTHNSFYSNPDQENKSRDSFPDEKQQLFSKPELSSDDAKKHKSKEHKEDFPLRTSSFENLFSPGPIKLEKIGTVVNSERKEKDRNNLNKTSKYGTEKLKEETAKVKKEKEKNHEDNNKSRNKETERPKEKSNKRPNEKPPSPEPPKKRKVLTPSKLAASPIPRSSSASSVKEDYNLQKHNLETNEHKKQKIEDNPIKSEEVEIDPSIIRQHFKRSRKCRSSLTDIDNSLLKRERMDVNVISMEDSELAYDVQDEPRHDELHNAFQSNRCIPHQLIRLMYQLDLSVLCSLRESIYKHKYPSLSLAFGDSQIDEFNNIVIRYKKKSIHVQIENVDKYYIDNSISYARLFTKEKRSFSINNYFDSFVKHLISKSDNSLSNIEYLIIYTNSGLDLTEEKYLKEGRFKNFYPFKFDSINIEEQDLLKDFLFTNDNTPGSGFYQFSRDKTIRKELLKRLEFTCAVQREMKVRKLSLEKQEQLKEEFLDKLLFAVNQPSREELNSIIKNEIDKNCIVQNNHIELQEKILCDLTASEKRKKNGNCIPEIIYQFKLLLLFLHDMFLHKNISFINSESHGTTTDITINYKDGIIYIKPHNADTDIGFSQLFPSRQHTFSINKHLTLFVEELKDDTKYFIIYTNVGLDLTGEKKFKEGRSKDFYPLKFDKNKVLRDCLCINENGLYRFSQEESTRKKLLSLLKLPPSLQKEKEAGGLSSENKQEIKEKFLDKLIFATNQPNGEELNNIIKDEINKSNVPYNYEELHEIALRWLESHEFSNITEGIIKKLIEDVKNKRSSYKKIPNQNLKEEIKFARSVVGREGTPAFNQFLSFLIAEEGIKYLEILKREGIDLASMSSILHVAGANSQKAFKDLYVLWFDKKGNKTQYLQALEKEKINLSNISSILGGSGANAAKAFKGLYNLWFDVKGSKTQYLTKLKENGVDLVRMSSILSGSGAKAPKAFKHLCDLWFDKHGNKTQYLKALEKEEINLSNISSILNVAGANAAKAFKDLYDLWFDVNGGKTQHLNTLEKEEISLCNISSILSGAGANAPKAFKDLYDLWFDVKGNKTHYLNTLEKEGINLTNISSILNGAGANAAKAFKDLYDFWFDALGNKKRHLKHFTEGKDKSKCFTLHNLSSILSRAGANAKNAFERLHSVCFSHKGKRTQLLDDFFKADFRPSNLSCTLCGTGARASFILKRLHSTCFNEKREKTKILDDFFKAGFRPCDLCGMLSAAANSLIRFHDFCFTGETKKYLHNFLKEEEGFRPNNLSKILHGAGTKIYSALKDFHDICFDETGNKTQLLNDFCKVGFQSSDLSSVLSMAGNNATSILRNFHKLCFNEDNYLKHFLAEKNIFTPKSLSNKILYGIGINVSLFERLHDLCFDKAGNKTNYLNGLIRNNPSNKIRDILYKKVRKAPPTFLDEHT